MKRASMRRADLEALLRSRNVLFECVLDLFDEERGMDLGGAASFGKILGGEAAKACVTIDELCLRLQGLSVSITLHELQARAIRCLSSQGEGSRRSDRFCQLAVMPQPDAHVDLVAYLGFMQASSNEALREHRRSGNSGRLRRMLALQLAFDCGRMADLLDEHARRIYRVVDSMSACLPVFELASLVPHRDAILLGELLGVGDGLRDSLVASDGRASVIADDPCPLGLAG